MQLRKQSLMRIAAESGLSLDEEKAVELIEGSWNEHVEQWRKGAVFGAYGAARFILGQLIPEAKSLDESSADRLAASLEDATSQVGTVVVEGASEAVRAVKAAGIPTALICDTGFTPSRHIRTFLEGHNIELDHLFFSDEVGEPKPSPVIFRRALEAAGADAEHSVHIGDLRRTDVAGARAFGMATIRFAGIHDDGWETVESKGEEADAVLYRWSELPGLLGIDP